MTPAAIILAGIASKALLLSTQVAILSMNEAHASMLSREVYIQVSLDTSSSIQAYIARKASENFVDPHLAVFLAQTESQFDPLARNPKSSATGIYQFINSTWKENCVGIRTNAKDNIDCAIKLLSQGQIYHWTADPAGKKKLKDAGFIK